MCPLKFWSGTQQLFLQIYTFQDILVAIDGSVQIINTIGFEINNELTM